MNPSLSVVKFKRPKQDDERMVLAPIIAEQKVERRSRPENAFIAEQKAERRSRLENALPHHRTDTGEFTKPPLSIMLQQKYRSPGESRWNSSRSKPLETALAPSRMQRGIDRMKLDLVQNTVLPVPEETRAVIPLTKEISTSSQRIVEEVQHRRKGTRELAPLPHHHHSKEIERAVRFKTPHVIPVKALPGISTNVQVRVNENTVEKPANISDLISRLRDLYIESILGDEEHVFIKCGASGEVFRIDGSLARVSGTLWHIHERSGSFMEGNTKLISFPSITPDAMRHVIAFLYFMRLYETGPREDNPGSSFQEFYPYIDVPSVLEVLSAAVYLDLIDLAHLCADVAADNSYGLEDFGDLPTTAIRAIMKRMNIMDLCLTEHDVLPKTLARPGPRDSDVLHYSQVTRMIWQQHYFELLGTFSDAAECVPCMRTALVQFYTQAKIDSTSSDQNPIDPRLVRFLDLEQAHLKKLEFEWGTNVEPSKRATFRTLPTFQHLEEVVLYVKLGSTLQTIRKSGEFANALIEVANRMPRILFNINIHVGLLDDHDDQIYSRDDCPIDDHVLQVLSEGLASIPPESDTNGKQKRESFQLDSSEFKSIRLRAIDETNGPIVQARVRPMNISFTLKFHSRISGSYLAECRQVLQQCGVQSGLGIDLRDASFQMNDGLWTKCINIFEVLTSLNLSGCMLGGKCIQDLCSAILKSAKLVGCAIRELKLSENIAEGDSNCLDASKTLVDLLSCNTVPRGTLELLDISCNYFSAHGLDSIITTFAAPSSFVSRLRILDLSDTNIDPSMGNLGRVLGLGHLSSLESLKLSNNRLWPRALSIFVNEWRAHLDTRQTSAARKFRLKELELGQNLFDETIICDSPGTLRGNRSGSSTRHGCLALVLTSNMMDRLARLDLSGGEHGPYLGDNGCMQLLRILFHSSPNPNASREKQRSRLKYLNLSCQQVGDKTCEYLGRLFMVKTQTFWIDHLVLRANRATDDGVECMMRGAATVAGTDAALLFRKYCPGGDCDGPVRGMLFDLSNNLLSDDGIDRCRSFSINNTNGHIILVRR